MNKPLSHIAYVLGCLLMPVALASCSVIDEDLSQCEVNPEEKRQATLDYDLRLVTNMTTELTTELTTQTDIELANALKDFLGDIFSDFAHDVDLSFYDTAGDSLLLQKDEHIMDANQASYALNLPMREYMHLAAANVVDNELVSVMNDNRCHKSKLSQVIRDTIDSHSTGLFTARQLMEIRDDVSQNFDVHLYMANCAAALVIDPRGHGLLDKIRVYSTGFATGFNISDSVYTFNGKAPIFRTMRLETPEKDELAFTSVTFPSRESKESATRSVIETEEPFIAQPGEESLWEFHVYVTQPDGSITKTVLNVKTPLRAGQFKIIKCWIGDQGEIIVPSDEPDPGPGPGPGPDPDPSSVSSEVTTSVTFNWEDGLVIEN